MWFLILALLAAGALTLSQMENLDNITSSAYRNYTLQVDTATSPNQWTPGTVSMMQTEGGTIPRLGFVQCPQNTVYNAGTGKCEAQPQTSQTPVSYNIPYYCQTSVPVAGFSSWARNAQAFMGIVDRDTALSWNNVSYNIWSFYSRIPWYAIINAVYTTAGAVNPSNLSNSNFYRQLAKLSLGIAGSGYSKSTTAVNYYNNVVRPWANSWLAAHNYQWCNPWGQCATVSSLPSLSGSYALGDYRSSTYDMPAGPDMYPLSPTYPPPSTTVYGDSVFNITFPSSAVDNLFNTLINYYNGSTDKFILLMPSIVLPSQISQYVNNESQVQVLVFYDSKINWHYIYGLGCVGTWVSGCLPDETYDPTSGYCVKYQTVYSCPSGSTYNSTTGKCEGSLLKSIINMMIH